MKSTLKALGLVALVVTVSSVSSFAGTDAPADSKEVKDLKKQMADAGINYVETAQKGITLSGYVDTSYTYQFASKGQQGNASSEAQLRQFDTQQNSFNVNAVKIALEKALSDKNELSAGFRVDTIYGSDARFLGDSAFGNVAGTATGSGATPNNTSGLALEQAFVKFKIPVGNGIEVDFGKMVTLLGYEVIESPANLNFSRGLLFTNAIPLTQTGAIASYNFNDTFSAKFGVIDGWNNSQTTNAGGDRNSQFAEALTGQLTINAPGKNANITQSFIFSPQGDSSAVAGDSGPMGVYDIWGNWTPTFVKDNKLLLGFNFDYGFNNASGDSPNGPLAAAPSTQRDAQDWYGVALYSKYQFTKVFSLAGRGEYLHSNGGLNSKFGTATNNNNDDYSFTLTAGFNVWDNLLTRVEYRYDNLNGGSGNGADQHELLVNAVYSF